MKPPITKTKARVKKEERSVEVLRQELHEQVNLNTYSPEDRRLQYEEVTSKTDQEFKEAKLAKIAYKNAAKAKYGPQWKQKLRVHGLSL
jgi:hypothetical protein